jgi:hypothetical protein
MKKLTSTILFACALLVLSCNKDPLTTNQGQTPGQTPPNQTKPEVNTVSVTGTTADLKLYIHSSFSLSNSNKILIPGILTEEFTIQNGQVKEWKLNNLVPGTYRATLLLGETTPYPIPSYYYFSMSLEITDVNGIHRINPTQFGPSTHVFDLKVVN